MNRNPTRFGRSLVRATSLAGCALLLHSPGAFAAAHAYLAALPFVAAGPLAPAAEVPVSGRVIDSKGEGLPGVSVVVKGSTTGTSTGVDGSFSLQVPEGSTLTFTFVGYAKQELVITGANSTVAIKMLDDAQALGDVVVVGYGEQKKETMTGAIATVGSKVFQDRGVVENPLAALQGQVPGVTVTRAAAAPGRAGWNFQIRGATSTNGTEPLIVIDGVPVSSQDALNSINPNDIDNISFLKDASAAIYGARAAGGVVLITTKRAKAGKPVVQYDGSVSQKVIGLQPELLNVKQFGQALVDAVTNDFYGNATQAQNTNLWYRYGQLMVQQPSGTYLDRTQPGVSIAPLLSTDFSDVRDFTFFDTNWVDELWQKAYSTQHNLSLSGRTDKAGYRVSLGYLNDGSLLKWGNNSNKRYNVRLTNDFQFSDKFRLDTNIALERQDITAPTLISGVLGMYQQPGFPVSTITGQPYAWGGQYSPNWQAELGGDNLESITRVYTNLRGTYEFSKHLRLVSQVGYNWTGGNISEQQNTIPWYNYAGTIKGPTNFPTQANSFYSRRFNKDSYANVNSYLNYTQVFGEKHDLGLTVGVNYERDEYNSFFTRTNNTAGSSVPALNLGIGDPASRSNDETRTHYAIGSLFARANYAFNQRYLLEVNARYDGSSKFDSKDRWKFFYGVSGGWRLTEEKFLKDKVGFLNELKPRISFGVVGNQSGIGLYDYIQVLNVTATGGPTSGGFPIIGANPAVLVSPTGSLVSLNRTWETVENTNFGLDVALFNRRLTGSFDYFIKHNRNMLLQQQYPATLGASAPSENIGHLRVWGWEAALNWQDKIGSVGYRVGGSITDNQNRLISFGGANVLSASGFVSALEGYPLNSYFGLEYAGRIQTQEQLDTYRPLATGNNVGIPLTTSTAPGVRLGDNMFRDLNGDGKLTAPEDLKYLGRNDPRYSYAINLGADWKGFDFTAILQGVGERTIFRNGNWRVPFAAVSQAQTTNWYGNTWTPQNTEAYYPNLSAGQNAVNYNAYNYQVSDWSVENGAYIRLKNVVLGYSLPQALTRRFGAERVRIYYAGSDLWEKTNIRDGWDPEATREVTTFSRYPFFRLHTAGVNFTF